ncbi:MAG: GNAT family N-acetyltransferase [Eubacteriales bacterium]|nr:GNAT family N-acetyltransferase [Eubacteriales bacterium]
MVTLRKIDEYNFAKVIRLEVAEDQQDFVTPNSFSLSQAYVMPECRPLAIYNGMTPVGFAMYALDRDEDEYWVYRLMIDKNQQKKGYGRAAMQLLIEHIKKEAPEKETLYISFEPHNEGAKRLYSSLGFAPDGREVDGETVYRLQLR